MFKNRRFTIAIIVLAIVLVFVSFYSLVVHIPYYNHQHHIDELRNQICETNNYEYLNYCFEYRGQNKYYILKVNIRGVTSYVAYDEKAQLIATYSKDVFDEKEVIKAIEKKYKGIEKGEIKELDVIFENGLFCYYTKVQKDNHIVYIYYNLQTGEFVKSYSIG